MSRNKLELPVYYSKEWVVSRDKVDRVKSYLPYELKAAVYERPTLLPEKVIELEGMLERMADEEGKLEATLKKITYKFTDAMRRYYFGVCVPTVMIHWKETRGENITKDEVYAMDLLSFGTKPEIKSLELKNGATVDIIVMVGDTISTMKKEKGIEFINHVIEKWATEEDCMIPEPSKYNYITDFI